MESELSVFNNLHPVATKRASEAIYEQVKGLILSGELKPDDRLPSERNMMEIFQRSRPTIREALRMLERSGYIRTIAGSNGAVVLKPDEKNMEESVEDALRVGRVTLAELGEYRKCSEASVAVWAAQRRTQEDLSALDAVMEKMKANLGRADDFIALDAQFHSVLAEAGKNRIGVVMNRTLGKLNRSFMSEKMHSMSEAEQLSMTRKVYAQHAAVMEAIHAQDAQRARLAMEEHMDSFNADLRM